MSTVEALRALRRGWWLCAVGIALTAVVVVVVVDAETIYWTSTEVRLVGPPDADSNGLVDASDAVIAMAGLLAADINQSPRFRVTSQDVSIVDLDVPEGVLIRLPNSGGQWANNFTDPVLDIQVSGATPESVANETRRQVGAIQSRLQERQRAYGVTGRHLIRSVIVPPVPVVQEARGRTKPARLVAGALGIALTLVVTVQVFGRRGAVPPPVEERSSVSVGSARG